MQSKRDHGEGKIFPPNGPGAIAPAAGAQASATTQAPPPAHPALAALARLLAREAARKFLAVPHAQIDPQPGKGDLS